MIVALLAKGNSPDASVARIADIRSHWRSDSGRDSDTVLPFGRTNMCQFD
jgi:hypothetical protein